MPTFVSATRVQALRQFGVPNALPVAGVEKTLGFELALDPAAIARRAGELERLFHRVRLGVPDSFRRLSSPTQDALKMVARAIQLLDPPFRIQSNPFGETFERLFMGTPALQSLRPFYRRWGGPFNFLQPEKKKSFHGFLPGMEEVVRPPGGGMYPLDIGTMEDFSRDVSKGHPWRDPMRIVFERNLVGGLEVVPYSRAFRRWLSSAADLVQGAATLLEGEQPALAASLRSVVWAFQTNDFRAADLAWLRLTDGPIDIQMGAVEQYMDKVRKALAQLGGGIFLRDPAKEEKIARLKAAFPRFEDHLPVDDSYKKPLPLRVPRPVFMTDLLFGGGDQTAGEGVAAAFSRPNDDWVRDHIGFKIIILSNLIEAREGDPAARFVTERLISKDQKGLVTAEAFTLFVVFHEMAHGNGVEHVQGNTDLFARSAIGEPYGALEELRADIVGLHNAKTAADLDLISRDLLRQIYVSIVQRCLKMLRKGIEEAHAKGCLVTLNYLIEKEVVSVDPSSGVTRVDLDRMPGVIAEFSRELIHLKGSGDPKKVEALFARYGGEIPPPLERIYKEEMSDLPLDVDVSFEFDELLDF